MQTSGVSVYLDKVLRQNSMIVCFFVAAVEDAIGKMGFHEKLRIYSGSKSAL